MQYSADDLESRWWGERWDRFTNFLEQNRSATVSHGTKFTHTRMVEVHALKIRDCKQTFLSIHIRQHIFYLLVFFAINMWLFIERFIRECTLVYSILLVFLFASTTGTLRSTTTSTSIQY